MAEGTCLNSIVYSSHSRHTSTWLIVPVCTELVKSGNVASKHVRRAVYGTYRWYVASPLLFFLQHAWIFSNSVVINLLSSFSVPFSVISVLRSARRMSLLSVGVVEKVEHIMDTDTLHATAKSRHE